MKIKNNLIVLCAVVLVLALSPLLGKSTKLNANSSSLPVQYSDASWAYSYKDLNELADKSDLIALVKIAGVNKEFQKDNIDFTTYNATVEDAIVNSEDNQNVILYMTGINNNTKHIEIRDDPLPNKDDEFLIFAKKNSDGTYTILGGPQGRLTYKDGKLNSLNHVSDRVGATNIEMVNKDFDDLKSKIKEHKINKEVNID